MNDSTFDGQESDQLSETRSIQSQILSSGKDGEYDSAQSNDIPPLQNRRVRNPSNVLQRISSMMAIKNNVRIHSYSIKIVKIKSIIIMVQNRTICRAIKILNSINFGCQIINQKNAMNVHKNFQHFDENIIVVCVDKYFVHDAVIKLYLEKLSIVRVS